jgi:diacylglycerol kinase family enzyme
MLVKRQKLTLTLTTDTETIHRKAYMVVIANATKYGTGALINPNGNVGDGKLEAVVVRKINILELFKLLITHKPFHPNRVEIFCTKNLQITSRHRAYFQVDGEYRGRIKDVKAEIMPGCLQVMVPNGK